LLRRERQQSHLTELGRRMLPLMRQCYEASVSAKSLAKAVNSNTVAPLSIALSDSIDLGLLAPALAELARAYPGMRLKLLRGKPSEILEIMKRGDADLAIAASLGEGWDRLDSWPIFSEGVELVTHAEHQLACARESEIRVEHLVGEQLLSQPGSDTAEALSRSLVAKGITLDTAHEVDSDHDLIVLAGTKAGIGFVPQTAPRAASVRRLPVNDLDIRRTVAVYTVAGRLRSPVATAMLNMLRSADWVTLGVTEPALSKR
jgi:DNA-binding transcriptional LysR family regulator